jgi:hypothetical protein
MPSASMQSWFEQHSSGYQECACAGSLGPAAYKTADSKTRVMRIWYSALLRHHAIYTPGGMKRHITSISPDGSWRIQTCMRPSFDCRTGKSCGTIAFPCFDVTTSCGTPPPVGTSRAKLSTGAQSLSLQHSRGYQECALAANAEPDTKTKTNAKMRGLFITGFLLLATGITRCFAFASGAISATALLE